MTFKEIIKENTDRIFIVDTECFVIFTGSSINDDRPFIRIGTWYDLPVEIIPLIENIIITDRILGNPAHEQFNIDIKNLIANRYIGGESILRRFLDYQKNFGLDLTNVSVVNIEKDIPELPRHSNISDRDQFIGVFYSDGNIKIVNEGTDIFNLNNILAETVSISGMQERISLDCKGSDRYSGAGFVITDNNPVFYSGGYFTSYQYPSSPLRDFSRLHIDPARVREVLLPSQNILNLSSLMKFKNFREGRIKIFSDNPDQVELIKKLFKNCTLLDERFSTMNHNTGDGLTLSTYENSPNVKLVYRLKNISQDEINVSFIKLHRDTKKILRGNPDLVIITYTAYEESSLLFKSSEVPVIIIDDGNRNISRIGESLPVVKKGIQYELRKFTSENDLLAQTGIPEEIISAFSSKEYPVIRDYFDSLSTDKTKYAELFNAAALLRFYLNNTDDRKFYSQLKDIQQKHFIKAGHAIQEEEYGNYRVLLAFYGKGCYQLISRLDDTPAEIFTDSYSSEISGNNRISDIQKISCERILADRERLGRLLKYFYEDRKSSDRFTQLEEQVNELREKIDNRKEVYSDDLLGNGDVMPYSPGNSTGINSTGKQDFSGTQNISAGMNSGIKNIFGGKKSGPGKGSVKEAAPHSAGNSTENMSFPRRIYCFITGKAYAETESADNSFRKGRLLVIIAIPLILIIIVAAVLTYRHISGVNNAVIHENKTENEPGTTGEIITVKRINEEEKELLEKRNVLIRDMDIYNYANDVAVKNGYDKLDYSGLRNKNPNWIYPANVFIMLDGEKIVVQKGDTLWDLAHAKLQKMNADFYKIIEEVEKSDPSDKKRINELLDRAGQLAYIAQQKAIINSYKSKPGNE